MTVLGTGISWTNSTWGLAIGCNKVSAGCENCYAETLVHRLPHFKQKFDEVRLHLDRLKDVRKFTPKLGPDNQVLPHMVFVNSLSDFWHDAIPDEVIWQILDVMEAHPRIIFQILTKRPIRARKLLVQRYGSNGIPSHIWMGVSVEDNRVAPRLAIWRSIKERTGSATLFASVEPIVGPTDALDFTGIDWAIFGGESGPAARIMHKDWLLAGIENAQRAGAAIWLKQHGQIRSNPLLGKAPYQLGVTAKFKWLVDHGLEKLPDEKGGATLDDGVTHRELPPQFHALKVEMNAGLKAGVRIAGPGTLI